MTPESPLDMERFESFELSLRDVLNKVKFYENVIEYANTFGKMLSMFQVSVRLTASRILIFSDRTPDCDSYIKQAFCCDFFCKITFGNLVKYSAPLQFTYNTPMSPISIVCSLRKIRKFYEKR